MILFVAVFLGITGTYLGAYVLYNLVLLAAHFTIRGSRHQNTEPRTVFAVIIPSHNEELFLGRLLASLKQQRYPSDRVRLIVVADNCTDATPEIATSAGALVLERHDAEFRGKGYALKYALDSLELMEYDAFFIVDADSVVDPDGLRCLDARTQKGDRVIQCYNGVANPDDTWFTRIMDVSRTISNEIIEPAKERLGLSSHLMGNGMCFCRDIILEQGWEAFTVGEDWEYYAKIVDKGETVAFAREVRVYHQESKALKQATAQRMRWSSGRFAIAYKYALRLFAKGVAERDIRKVDASLPLLFPNPSMGVNVNVVLLLISIATLSPVLIAPFAVMLMGQILLFLVGITYTKKPFQKLLSVSMVPAFLSWKMVVDLCSSFGLGRKNWVRTDRVLSTAKKGNGTDQAI
jgi:1,2-diacylglycerol 3-beta-glucosyltransferase